MNIAGMQGLGDNLYQRAFVRHLRAPTYLQTPWPELYRDIPGVHFVRPTTKLRTQSKNIARYGNWHRMPARAVRQISYGGQGTIPGMTAAFGVRPGEFTLPDFGASPIDGDYVLVRPVTVRSEWRADSRNPAPEYVADAAAIVRRSGVKVVSVADLVPGVEWAIDPLPKADITFHAGELAVDRLMALAQSAKMIIGGIGWIVPFAISAKVPAWFICGGNGGFNAPDKITAPGMDLSRIAFAIPDRFCLCTKAQHNCDKKVTGHAKRFTEFARRWVGVE